MFVPPLGRVADVMTRIASSLMPARQHPPWPSLVQPDSMHVRSVPAQVFYAACQGLLYVLCYRMDHLMAPVVAAQQQHAPTGSPESGAAPGAAGGHVPALQRLFSEVMPQLLSHRCATHPRHCTPNELHAAQTEKALDRQI